MYIKLLDNYWPLVATGLGNKNIFFFLKSLQKLHSIFVEHFFFLIFIEFTRQDWHFYVVHKKIILFLRENKLTINLFLKNLTVKKNESQYLVSCYSWTGVSLN